MDCHVIWSRLNFLKFGAGKAVLYAWPSAKFWPYFQYFLFWYTRHVRKLSSHFEYLENRSSGLDVTWHPVRRDLTAHAWTVALPWGSSIGSETPLTELVYCVNPPTHTHTMCPPNSYTSQLSVLKHGGFVFRPSVEVSPAGRVSFGSVQNSDTCGCSTLQYHGCQR